MKLNAFVQEAKTRQYTMKVGETFTEGAFVVLDGTPEVTECGADPASILGIALHVNPATTDWNYRKVLVALAQEDGMFWIQGNNNPLATDVNTTQSIAVDGDGIWGLDDTDGANQRCYIHDVDLVRNLYLVSVLAANRQIAP
jgi:hypothetical protein